MNRKIFIMSLWLIIASFFLGWGAAIFLGYQNEFVKAVQALPIIRSEYFDPSRNALIIAVFNPGGFPVEIDETKLIYQTMGKNPSTTFDIREYGNRPLVLDPGDTILVPLVKTISVESQTNTNRYWGVLKFRTLQGKDFFSLHHRFNTFSFKNN